MNKSDYLIFKSFKCFCCGPPFLELSTVQGSCKSCGGFSKVIMKRSRLITGTALPNGIAKCLIKVGARGGFSFNKLKASKEACSFAL